MATLNNSDLTWCIEWIKSHPAHRVVLKASGLSKAQLYAILQAIEDYSVGSYTVRPGGTLRAAIDTAAGMTPTTPQNQAIWYAWAAWKARVN